MKGLRIILFLLVFIVFLLPLFAQEGTPAKENPWRFKVEGLRVLWWGAVPTGADVSLTYKGFNIIEGVYTKLFFKLGGGYEEKTLYRNVDGTPYTGSSDNREIKYRSPNVQWETAFIQGILPNPELGDNLLESFIFYRGRYDYNYYLDTETVTPFIFDQNSLFTDQSGLFANSFMAGLSYNNKTSSKHQTINGVYAEISAEWGPLWLGNNIFGNTDYFRINSQAKGFLTVFDLNPEREKNIFSVYLGDYISADYASGSSIPIYVMQSFGGRKLRKGLGGAVRGFEKRGWDTNIKVMNNLELRINCPAVYFASCIPTLFVYFDSGYYYSYSHTNEPYNTEGGFLCSIGSGIAINVFGVEHLRLSFDFPVYGERLDGNSYYMDIAFGLHF